ncbi:MAG: hypothetical protein UV67_C0020G0007 [Parcubacteria group bacterium GW2011_GWC1_43_12]|nr:MAG: hypothetical protein UV34_C0028G0004 [Parcubacteria group bacterium GW2011_GWB1_42_6]KKS91744.1 MAG: hypothetical protein UV67_C0020G0007 [Parcubacteria group bacterium GW2011_GWC1_43_12]
MFNKAVLKIIRTYQNVFSFDRGIFANRAPVCRFSPTCSQYTYEAIEKFGIIKGIFFGIKRVLRCHPWNKGGFDPVNK